MPSNKEIEITLTLKDEATKKIRSFRSSVKEFSKDTKDSLAPILQLRRSWMLTSLAIGATVGTIIKGISEVEKLRKEVEALDVSAIKLGITSKELSKQIYGFNIGTVNARIGMAQAHAIVEETQRIKKGIGATLSNIWGGITKWWRADKIRDEALFGGRELSWPKAMGIAEQQLLSEEEARKSRSKEAIQINIELTQKIKQLALSEFEYKKHFLNEELAIFRKIGADKIKLTEYEKSMIQRLEEDRTIVLTQQQAIRLKTEGRTLDALKLEQQNALIEFKRQFGGDGEMVREFIRGQEAMLEAATYNYFGIKTNFQIMREGYLDTINAMTSAMGGFYDTTTGEFKSLTEIAANFGRTLIGIINQMIAQFIIAKAIMGISNLFGFGGITGGVGGTTFQTAQFGTVWSPFHKGGIIRAHTGLLAYDEVPVIAQAGEGIISRKGMAALGTDNFERINRGEKAEGQQTVVNYYIYAVDAASFAALCIRNPEGIHVAMQQAFRQRLTTGQYIKGQI